MDFYASWRIVYSWLPRSGVSATWSCPKVRGAGWRGSTLLPEQEDPFPGLGLFTQTATPVSSKLRHSNPQKFSNGAMRNFSYFLNDVHSIFLINSSIFHSIAPVQNTRLARESRKHTSLQKWIWFCTKKPFYRVVHSFIFNVNGHEKIKNKIVYVASLFVYDKHLLSL